MQEIELDKYIRCEKGAKKGALIGFFCEARFVSVCFCQLFNGTSKLQRRTTIQSVT